MDLIVLLEQVVGDWLAALIDARGSDVDRRVAARTATLVIATIRGLLLDLLATGNHDRVEDAAAGFLAGLAGTSVGVCAAR